MTLPSPPLTNAPQHGYAHRTDTAFVSGAARCAGWLYHEPGHQASTCIVMAHGFGATRHYGLDPYARRFREQGHDVLIFDYRHFGESDGEPRGLLKVNRQLADWHAALAHVRALGYQTIVVWGSSFAGGHVLRVAAEDGHVAAVISQVPHTSGLATSLAVPLRSLPRLLVAMARDAVSLLFGRRHTIPAFGPEGSVAAMATPGAHDALVRMLPRAVDGAPNAPWRAYFDAHNQVTALGLVETLLYSPGRCASRIKCPVLLQAGRRDATTPFEAARKTAARIQDCDFRAHDMDHFDVYLGQDFEIVIDEQIGFLRHAAPPEAASEPGNPETFS